MSQYTPPPPPEQGQNPYANYQPIPPQGPPQGPWPTMAPPMMAPPPPPKRRRWPWVVAALVVLLFVFVGCSAVVASLAGEDEGQSVQPTTPAGTADEPETDDPTTAEEPTTEEPTTEVPEPQGEPDGSRDNPGLFGENTFQATSIDDDGVLTITPVEVIWDANDIVADENMFNEEPGADEKYIIVKCDFVYEGPSSMDPFFDTTMTVLNDGRTYDQDWAVIPNQASDIGDLYDGGEASGNFVFLVPSDADAGNTLIGLTTGWGDEPLWYQDSK